MKVATTILAAAATLGHVQAQEGTFYNFGFCPSWPVIDREEFKPELYAGTWFEIARDKDLWYEQDVECVTATYTYKKDEWFYPVMVNNRNYKRKEDVVTNTQLDPTKDDLTYARARFDKKGYGNVKFWWYPEGNY